MTRWITTTLVCPCCHRDFETTLVVSTTYGSKVQTDFRQRTLGAGAIGVADDWFARAEQLARKAGDLDWLAELAAQQRTDPREFVE